MGVGLLGGVSQFLGLVGTCAVEQRTDHRVSRLGPLIQPLRLK